MVIQPLKTIKQPNVRGSTAPESYSTAPGAIIQPLWVINSLCVSQQQESNYCAMQLYDLFLAELTVFTIAGRKIIKWDTSTL